MEKLLRMIVAIHTRVLDVAEHEKDRGATATEYAVLVSFIALIIIVGVTAFGNNLSGWFNTLSTKVTK
jgi:pilus assembly protein Flp/PilA